MCVHLVFQHGFYGLSDIDTGCTPCDCDVGGSISEACDQTTGACTCKPNIIGKQCNEPRPGYYYAMLDYLLYEAELAKGFGVSLRTNLVICNKYM